MSQHIMFERHTYADQYDVEGGVYIAYTTMLTMCWGIALRLTP